MINAEKFKEIFNIYATELWAMSEKNFLKWLNSEYKDPNNYQENIIPDEYLYHLPPSISMNNQYCQTCNNNPANGGTGICHCILGSYLLNKGELNELGL